jgi:hypothetical protein
MIMNKQIPTPSIEQLLGYAAGKQAGCISGKCHFFVCKVGKPALQYAKRHPPVIMLTP